jgi:hypothetical protein
MLISCDREKIAPTNIQRNRGRLRFQRGGFRVEAARAFGASEARKLGSRRLKRAKPQADELTGKNVKSRLSVVPFTPGAFLDGPRNATLIALGGTRDARAHDGVERGPRRA